MAAAILAAPLFCDPQCVEVCIPILRATAYKALSALLGKQEPYLLTGVSAVPLTAQEKVACDILPQDSLGNAVCDNG